MVNTAITGRKLRTGIIYGPNPKTATNWCDQPTGPTNRLFNYITFIIKNGFWGVQNAKRTAFRNHTRLGC